MPLCSSCGTQIAAGDICLHHMRSVEDDWAVSNRLMCDFFHRGIVPLRLTKAERDDDFWTAEGSPDVESPAA